MLPYQLHQKLRAAQTQQGTLSSSPVLQVQGLPFWIWDKEEHRQQASITNGHCCFNHIVGLPIKDGKEYPLFDYEQLLYDSLLEHGSNYTYGIGKIYTREEIAKAKQSPSFAREYDLQYLGLIGNTFHTQDIERAIELGKTYDPNQVAIYSQKVLGVDPGWGSSAFGIVLVQVADGMVQVLIAEEYERPRYQDMADKIMDIVRGLNRRNADKSVLDSQNLRRRQQPRVYHFA